MSYYWFNRKEVLEKAHKKYHKKGGKEKASNYYQRNKEAIKKAREKYKNLPREEKYKKKRIFKK